MSAEKAPAPLAEASVAEAKTSSERIDLPQIPTEPPILPPAIAIAMMAVVPAVVPYLLDRAGLNRAGLQRLNHARCRRSVRRGHRVAERSAQHRDRQ